MNAPTSPGHIELSAHRLRFWHAARESTQGATCCHSIDDIFDHHVRPAGFDWIEGTMTITSGPGVAAGRIGPLARAVMGMPDDRTAG